MSAADKLVETLEEAKQVHFSVYSSKPLSDSFIEMVEREYPYTVINRAEKTVHKDIECWKSVFEHTVMQRARDMGIISIHAD